MHKALSPQFFERIVQFADKQRVKREIATPTPACSVYCHTVATLYMMNTPKLGQTPDHQK